MNDPLKQDFQESQNVSTTSSASDNNLKEPKLEDLVEAGSPSTVSDSNFLCEVCNNQFLTKKELRKHILTHLGHPRVVLKRLSNLKSFKKKSSDTYWLDPDKKGSLKLTLKKQSPCDSLKLTFKKKSAKSEAFEVVNNNFNLAVENKIIGDVADTKENDSTDAKTTEGLVDESFENVTDNDQDTKHEEKNNLKENERPSLDVNEGDSGVGSDMANALEKEDQNIDDLHNIEQYDNCGKPLSEIEDHEESDALEATCRETIENLKKLGEQSKPTSQLFCSSIEKENDKSDDSNMIHNLEENSAISIVAKPSTYNNHTNNEDKEVEKEVEEQQEVTEGFNWNELSTNLSAKTSDNSKSLENEPTIESDNNIENAGSLLQNFLIEHQRRNQSETTFSNSLPPVETEYVSLEKLAETVNTCRFCNEKFKDIAHLDEHKSKAGHYQCNIPDCSHQVFASLLELSIHKNQVHGTALSPNLSQPSSHLNPNSPHLNQSSPHCQSSPKVNTNSPHTVNVDSPTTSNPPQLSRASPLTSPHHTSSPTYVIPNTNQQLIPPVNFEQLPAPVQQLAQQVQRMPLPQPQMPPSLPPGASTIIPGSNYFVQPPGRPPLYRVPGPQGMHFPPHMSHLYSQYGPGPGSYPQMAAPPQMHPQLPQPISRGRYPSLLHNTRGPRIPQQAPVTRQRMKRPPQQAIPLSQQNSSIKQRRMDVLLPDRNEDADCHVIAQQKRNDGLPMIQDVQGATSQQSNRTDSTIHLTDSITLSVRQPAQTQNTSSSGKKSDAKAVANVLAARGITVTPAANKNKGNEPNKQQQAPLQQQRSSVQQQQPPLNVTALNLNSAISIIPTSSQRKQQEQAQFAVPQNKQSKSAVNEVERPPRPPTVDLTQDTPPPPQMPVVRRGRPPRAMLTCQVCDKSFQNQEMLSQHMATHRAPSKLLHKCNLCAAQYPTAQALLAHKQAYHKEVDTLAQNGGAELALPVVDLKSPHVLNRLSNLGIQSYIPLSQLSAQTGGYFGLPIITIDGARNPNICNLGALGATSILSLGPLKHFSNR
ncbi:transcription factor Zelda-like isoform X2 [Prorops nasuta]|uniref:transcription factor Zelda-like isoform X2 n=1 Tax=Prorops nasuta TaxID=863751 RepID=UPI0034CE3015